jgi:hypothetical protein
LCAIPVSPNSSELWKTLIVLAHGQGRNFLGYFLIMALMHLREEEDQRRPRATH